MNKPEIIKLVRALSYILKEINEHPNDSEADIMNEAFIKYELPFIADKEDWSVKYECLG